MGMTLHGTERALKPGSGSCLARLSRNKCRSVVEEDELDRLLIGSNVPNRPEMASFPGYGSISCFAVAFA